MITNWIAIGLSVVALGITWSGLSVRRSARAAAASSRTATEALEISRNEGHERRQPYQPARIRAVVLPSADGGFASLQGEFEVVRDAVVEVISLDGSGKRKTLPPTFLRANSTTRVELEHWPLGKTEAVTTAVLVRMWPPPGDSDSEPWTCPCERVATPDSEPNGHWQVHVGRDRIDVERF